MAEPAAAEMRFDYAAGQYAMSDFSGKTLSLRDKSGGVVDVEIFVAVLPYSNLIYAEAVLDQKIKSWAMAHRRALEYFKARLARSCEIGHISEHIMNEGCILRGSP